MNIGDLFWTLRGDGARLETDAKKAGLKAGDTAGKSFNQQFSKGLKGGFEGLKLGAGIGAFNLLTGAASGAVDAIFDSIDAASDLNETVSKGRVIFGENAAEIESWADRAAESFGQSKRQAIDTASGFAGLFDTVGIELGKATGMAQELTLLGSDLASFFNTDVQTALDAIKSGLAGQSEPLRQFNVFLSETAVSAKLAQMGIKRVGGQFTESQKATARYALILEQTGSAQGDFERTADGMANQQKTLNAQLADTSAELGQVLIPFVLELQRAAIGAVGSITDLGDALNEVATDVTGSGDPLGDFALGLGVLIEAGTHAGNAMGFFREKTQEMIEAQNAANQAAARQADVMDETERAIRRAAGATGDALGGVGEAGVDMGDDVEGGAETAAESIEDMRDRIIGAAKDVVEQAYGILDDRAELSAVNAEIAAARRVLASKTSTAAEKRDAKEALRELGEDQASLVLSLAEAGSAGSKSVSDALVDMRERLTTAVGQERLAIEATIKALELLETQGGKTFLDLGHGVVLDPNTGGKRLTGRATGGPVRKDAPYIVGERGPEVLVPQKDGYVVPELAVPERGYVLPSMESPAFQSAAQWTGGGTQTIEVPVYLDGQVLTRVVARNLADELNH